MDHRFNFRFLLQVQIMPVILLLKRIVESGHDFAEYRPNPQHYGQISPANVMVCIKSMLVAAA